MKLFTSDTAQLFVSSILHNFKDIPWECQHKLGKVQYNIIFKKIGNRGPHGLQKKKKNKA